jgi:hypothetical protein
MGAALHGYGRPGFVDPVHPAFGFGWAAAGHPGWGWWHPWGWHAADWGWGVGAWAWGGLAIGAGFGLIVAPPVILAPPIIYALPPPVVVVLPAIAAPPLVALAPPVVAVGIWR